MDEVEITNLLYRYAEHIDSGDLEAAAELFRDARVKLYPEGELLNHRELLAVWREAIIIYADGTPKTRHLVSNPIIDIDRERGTARCRSCYTVTQSTETFPLQMIASGRYQDEFIKVDGQWRYAFRDYSLHDARGDMSHHVRSRPSPQASVTEPPAQTRGDEQAASSRIFAAARQAFSSSGYAESGIRKIADMAGLSSALVSRHFGSKAALFESVLRSALAHPVRPADRSRFGWFLAELLADPGDYLSSHSMTLLAVGNEEAREIVTRVLQECGIAPLAEWLGPPAAESRARQILALCAGFVLYHSQLTSAETSDPDMVAWLADSLQAVVDRSLNNQPQAGHVSE